MGINFVGTIESESMEDGEGVLELGCGHWWRIRAALLKKPSEAREQMGEDRSEDDLDEFEVVDDAEIPVNSSIPCEIL